MSIEWSMPTAKTTTCRFRQTRNRPTSAKFSTSVSCRSRKRCSSSRIDSSVVSSSSAAASAFTFISSACVTFWIQSRHCSSSAARSRISSLPPPISTKNPCSMFSSLCIRQPVASSRSIRPVSLPPCGFE
eukprot:SAG22_NODE_635_length_8370_cov_33.081127_8_plen_130_part_00